MKSAVRFFVQNVSQKGISVYGLDNKTGHWGLPSGAYDVALVGNIHDEAQVIVSKGLEDKVAPLVHKAFEQATEYHKLKCPVRTEVKFGSSWANTH